MVIKYSCNLFCFVRWFIIVIVVNCSIKPFGACTLFAIHITYLLSRDSKWPSCPCTFCVNYQLLFMLELQRKSFIDKFTTYFCFLLTLTTKKWKFQMILSPNSMFCISCQLIHSNCIKIFTSTVMEKLFIESLEPN